MPAPSTKHEKRNPSNVGNSTGIRSACRLDHFAELQAKAGEVQAIDVAITIAVGIPEVALLAGGEAERGSEKDKVIRIDIAITVVIAEQSKEIEVRGIAPHPVSIAVVKTT